jgi:hypothetical protein
MYNPAARKLRKPSGKVLMFTDSYIRSLDSSTAAHFLESLTISTQQSRIFWVKEDGDVITGFLPAGFRSRFVTRPSAFDGRVLWELFTIHNPHGHEIFRVSRWDVAAGAFYLDELFLAVTQPTTDHDLPVC